MPTPVPMDTATMNSCTGNARLSAVSAASPPSGIRARYAESTTLYAACKIMDSTMGVPMRAIRRGTGSTAIGFCDCCDITSS